MTIVYCKWRDSNIYLTQCNPEEVTFEVEVIETVGFWLEENEDRLVLAGDCIGEESRRIIVIPRENIIKTKMITHHN